MTLDPRVGKQQVLRSAQDDNLLFGLDDERTVPLPFAAYTWQRCYNQASGVPSIMLWALNQRTCRRLTNISRW